MSYIKRVQARILFDTAELEPALRNMKHLSDAELFDQQFVVGHLKDLGLREMSTLVEAMTSWDFQDLVRELSSEKLEDDTELH